MDIYILGLLFSIWLVILYHHLFYPILLIALAKRRQRRRPDKVTEILPDESLPCISILVPAYNEAKYIAQKIHNLAALDYPPDKLQVWIICDGCTDNTFALACRVATDKHVAMLNIRVVNQRHNSGKTAVLNRYIPQLSGAIIALSDASALMSIDALKISASYFQQLSVAVVASCYQLENSALQGEAKYWQWQINIKRAEACLGSPIGMHGALYFFRAADFTPLASDTINDDFILPMSIIARGKKAIYSTDIIALELECSSASLDRSRRVRIGAGNLQQLLRCLYLLHPKNQFTAFNFASGKALRALMPTLLLLQILLCIALTASYPLLLVFALIQLGTVTSAWLIPDIPRLPKPLKIIFYAVNGYRWALLGSVLYCAQKFNKNWH